MAPVIVIRPQSGYINRLQAIVSAQLMAEELGGQLMVDWEPSSITPVGLGSVLSIDFCERFSTSSQDASRAVGIDVRFVPAHLNFDSSSGVVTLAGLDKGEQFFMPSLRSILTASSVSAIVISAGGKFTLSGGAKLTPLEQQAFCERRHTAYRALSLQQEVEEEAEDYVSRHGDFMALHLRYSDRSLESPWRWRIAPALRQLHRVCGVSSLFIASDVAQERDRWLTRAPSLGLHPWCVKEASALRTDRAGAHSAMVDWRLLTKAKASVYFAASSFAEEAAVASDGFAHSIGLVAGRSRLAWNQCRRLGHDAISYPKRLLETDTDAV